MSSIETYYGHTHKCKQPSNKTNNYQNNTNNTYNNNTRSINQSINEHNQNNSTLALGGECCGADSCCCLTSSISQSINHTPHSHHTQTHTTHPTHQRTICAPLWQSVNQSINHTIHPTLYPVLALSLSRSHFTNNSPHLCISFVL